MNATRLLALSFALIFFHATGAAAQGMAVYAPVSPQYSLGNFEYSAPQTDGWRQVSSDHSVLRLVYAELLSEDLLNTRADVVLEAFEIPDPALVTTGLALAQSALAQQVDKRKETMIGYTRVATVESGVETYAFTIASRLPDEKTRFETFFVSLAADKSQYLAAKLTIDEDKYEETPFYLSIVESYKDLTGPDAPAEEAGDAAGEAPAAEAAPDAAAP